MSASGRGWKVVGYQAQRRHRVLKKKRQQQAATMSTELMRF